MNFSNILIKKLYLDIAPFWTAIYKKAAGKEHQSEGVSRT
jgi:hypothetical protein